MKRAEGVVEVLQSESVPEFVQSLSFHIQRIARNRFSARIWPSDQRLDHVEGDGGAVAIAEVFDLNRTHPDDYGPVTEKRLIKEVAAPLDVVRRSLRDIEARHLNFLIFASDMSVSVSIWTMSVAKASSNPSI